MDDKMTILIIDDEKDLCDMLKFQLEKKGFNAVTAGNGIEGLKKLSYLKPALIILDINMPKMGGIEFYNEICDMENKPKFPVFVLTARANLDQLFKDFNVEGFMSKPFEVDDLIDEIGAILFKKKLKTEHHPEAKPTAKEVLVADDNRERLDKIAQCFLDAGYSVNTASDGITAIDHINTYLPDAALIKWELGSIPGDIVALKMSRMPRTKHIKFILYTERSIGDLAVMDEIRKRSGVTGFIESVRIQELLYAVNACCPPVE